jgi:hypothetical protein
VLNSVANCWLRCVNQGHGRPLYFLIQILGIGVVWHPVEALLFNVRGSKHV